MRFGIIGFGYWGPNIARNITANPDCELVAVSDIESERLATAQRSYPNVRITKNAAELISATDIDAVAIVAPVGLHYEFCKKALLAGKHVWVSKPLTHSVETSLELVELAEKQKLLLMVDHTFVFTGAVRKIKALLEDKVLGDPFYYDSVRVNLGLFQPDVNVLWDLAPHDGSLLYHLFPMRPLEVSAQGADHFKTGRHDLAYLTVYYQQNFIAHCSVNWLSPVKVRKTMIGGSKKMLVWNDLDPEERLKIYDKGVDLNSTEGIYSVLRQYRVGEMCAPIVSHEEALAVELKHFLDCANTMNKPINGGIQGAEVVALIEAACLSLKQRGAPIKIQF